MKYFWSDQRDKDWHPHQASDMSRAETIVRRHAKVKTWFSILLFKNYTISLTPVQINTTFLSKEGYFDCKFAKYAPFSWRKWL